MGNEQPSCKAQKQTPGKGTSYRRRASRPFFDPSKLTGTNVKWINLSNGLPPGSTKWVLRPGVQKVLDGPAQLVCQFRTPPTSVTWRSTQTTAVSPVSLFERMLTIGSQCVVPMCCPFKISWVQKNRGLQKQKHVHPLLVSARALGQSSKVCAIYAIWHPASQKQPSGPQLPMWPIC